MSQAERESSEVEDEDYDGTFVVNPRVETHELQDEADQRIEIVRGFLNLLACGQIDEEGNSQKDLCAVAYGSVKLLDEARMLALEHERRLYEKARPSREAAEKRRKRAGLSLMLTRAAMGLGKDRATARAIARECLAADDAEKAKGAPELQPSNPGGAK